MTLIFARIGRVLMTLVTPFRPAPANAIRRRLTWAGKVLLMAAGVWLTIFGVVRTWEQYEPGQHQSKWYREPSNPSNGLVVITHGWTKSPKDMEEVASVVSSMEKYSQHAVYLWGYDSGRFSNSNPRGLAEDLAIKIGELNKKVHGEIILVGHSLGGLLLRRAFLTGLDKSEEWARAVSRIILLAAPNRGTEATSHSRWLWGSDALAKSVGVGNLIRSTYRGAPFVVDLRLDWIRRFQTLQNPPLVAQIVGTKDQVVSANDSLDILQFPNSIDFLLPNSSHGSIIRRKESGPYVQKALMSGPSQREAPKERRVDTVKLLLVYGIRDYGERFQEIRRSVEAYADKNRIVILSSSPQYSYFSALEFLNPFSRKLKIYEFADMYAELLARPPVDAQILFVGHSFGTFLMGEGMKTYESMRFERAYLAGSVLDEEFFASNKFLGDRIKYLRNDIATSDWPVGILCSGIHGLGLAEDVGTGGFNGFTRIARQDRYEEIKFFRGGHGEALEPINYPTISDWLLQERGTTYNGTAVKDMLERANIVVNGRDYWWGFLSRAAPGIFVLVVTLVFYLLFISRQPAVSLVGIGIAMWLLNII